MKHEVITFEIFFTVTEALVPNKTTKASNKLLTVPSVCIGKPCVTFQRLQIICLCAA